MSLAHSLLRAIGTSGLIKLMTPIRKTTKPTITITTFTSSGHLYQSRLIELRGADVEVGVNLRSA